MREEEETSFLFICLCIPGGCTGLTPVYAWSGITPGGVREPHGVMGIEPGGLHARQAPNPLYCLSSPPLLFYP